MYHFRNGDRGIFVNLFILLIQATNWQSKEDFKKSEMQLLYCENSEF